MGSNPTFGTISKALVAQRIESAIGGEAEARFKTSSATIKDALVAQRIECSPAEAEVVGSNPAERATSSTVVVFRLRRTALVQPDMVWHVYILMNQDGRHYVGVTGRDLNQRFEEHNAGYSRWTRGHRPWRLVYSEPYDTKSLALNRERFFKTSNGRRLRDKLLADKLSQGSS